MESTGGAGAKEEAFDFAYEEFSPKRRGKQADPTNSEFTGKHVIVTGASSGIGKAVTLKLLRSGAFVVMIGRDYDKLKSVIESEDNYGAAYPYTCDLSNPLELQKTFRDIIKRLNGKLDILINAAGTYMAKNIKETTLKDWDTMLNVNLRAIFQLTSMSVPFLKLTHGNVVNVSSLAGSYPNPGATAYSVSKACLDMLTECCALELGTQGIRVNSVAPGVTHTELRVNSKDTPISKAENDNFLQKSKMTIPLNTRHKVNEPEDVADVILWLASDEASFVNGEILKVDGGKSLTLAGWQPSYGLGMMDKLKISEKGRTYNP